MQGIVITDLQGSALSLLPLHPPPTLTPDLPGDRRRILSTHFASSLAPTLAIDAALNASSPVTWVPAPTTTTDDDTDDDDDDDAAHSGRRRGGGGFAVCHTRRNQLRYIAPLDSDSALPTPLSRRSALRPHSPTTPASRSRPARPAHVPLRAARRPRRLHPRTRHSGLPQGALPSPPLSSPPRRPSPT